MEEQSGSTGVNTTQLHLSDEAIQKLAAAQARKESFVKWGRVIAQAAVNVGMGALGGLIAIKLAEAHKKSANESAAL